MEIKCSCNKSRKSINKFIDNKKNIKNKTIYDVVDLEIAREIRRDLIKTERNLERKVLYEFNAFTKEDIVNSKLTEKEIRILEYRVKNKYSYKKISEILNIAQSSIFETFENAKTKIEKYKKLSEKDQEMSKLSQQQKKIYKLLKKGKGNIEIAKTINTSPGNVRKQRSIINKKLSVTKKPE